MIAWKEGPKLPFGRGGAASGILRDRLIVAGGSYWEDGHKKLLRDVVSFHLHSREWDVLCPLPRPLAGAAGAVWGGYFFCIGGGDHSRASGAIYRAAHGSEAQEWEHWYDLPTPLSYCGAVVGGDTLYVIGGTPELGNLAASRADVIALNLRDPSAGWRFLPPLPSPGRSLFAATCVAGQLYVFGGCTAEPGGPVVNLGDAFCLTPGHSAWQALANPPVATRAWSAVTLEDRFIFLLGGYSTTAGPDGVTTEGRFESRVIRYDAREPRYSEIVSLPFSVADACFHGTGDMLYAAGGEPGARARSAELLIGRVAAEGRQ